MFSEVFLKVFFRFLLLKLFQQERRLKEKKILFCEPDCKDKDFLASLPNFQRSFFLKVKPHKSNPTGALSTFQENTLSLCLSCKAGAKVEAFAIQSKKIMLFFLRRKERKGLKRQTSMDNSMKINAKKEVTREIRRIGIPYII